MVILKIFEDLLENVGKKMCLKDSCRAKSEAHLGPCQASAMKLCCENN